MRFNSPPAHVVADDTGGFNRITVQLTPRVAPRDAVSFDIAYAGTPLFSADSINGIGPAWIELGLDSFWHPVFSTFDQRLTSRLRLRAPRGWDLVASGSVTPMGDALVVESAVPLLEERVGSGVMDTILRRYMTEGVASTPAFLTVVSDVAGAGTAAWLSAELARAT